VSKGDKRHNVGFGRAGRELYWLVGGLMFCAVWVLGTWEAVSTLRQKPTQRSKYAGGGG
jgi:hypothetical protein